MGVTPGEPCLADGVCFPFAVVIVVGQSPVVEVVEELDFVLRAEELLVGAEGLGGGGESCADAAAQVDLLFDLVVGNQVHVDGV